MAKPAVAPARSASQSRIEGVLDGIRYWWSSSKAGKVMIIMRTSMKKSFVRVFLVLHTIVIVYPHRKYSRKCAILSRK